jgi:hypothetical protein
MTTPALVAKFTARRGAETGGLGELANEEVATATSVARAGQATLESTPMILPHVPHDVQRICTEHLGCREVLPVQVLPSPAADPRHYVANISREMLTKGGRPVFGWRIRTSPLFVAAEFYAMHQTCTGLVDVTPNPRAENFVCFAPDFDVPADFNFLDRPPTRRFSTYVAPTRRERVSADMALMDRGVLAYERLRASGKSLTIEDALSLKLGPDKLETSLDLFIECSEELEKLTMAVIDGLEVLDLERFEFLQRRQATLEALVEEEFAQRQSPAPRKCRPVYPRLL